METTFKRDSEIISFRGGEKFSNKIVSWGLRIFSSETNEIVSFGGGVENIFK